MREQWAKELYVRGEKQADYDTIFEINKLAFGREDEGSLVNAIRKTRSYEFGFSLVAVKEDVILGHALFSKGFITHRNRRFKCLVLGPVAVLPEHQRRGVGKALIEEGLERAKEVGFGAVVVVGDPVYYSKFGFIPALSKKLRTTMKIPDENFMVKEISRNALRGIIGTVMFPREFLALAEADSKRTAEKMPADEINSAAEINSATETSPAAETSSPVDETAAVTGEVITPVENSNNEAVNNETDNNEIVNNEAENNTDSGSTTDTPGENNIVM